MSTEGIITGQFQAVGINQVDIDLLEKKWNHLWGIYQWDNTDYEKDEIISTQYRLVKMVRKDSPMKAFQTVIGEDQAKEIIERMGLTGLDGGFRSATTWKKVD